MPFYDFRCEECGKLVEDEFFKIADDKYIECCSIQMKQVILKAPGISDPNGVRGGWTNDGYQERDKTTGKLRTVTERWEKGKNVIRDDVHLDDPQRVVQKHANYVGYGKRHPDWKPPQIGHKVITKKQDFEKDHHVVRWKADPNWKDPH